MEIYFLHHRVDKVMILILSNSGKEFGLLERNLDCRKWTLRNSCDTFKLCLCFKSSKPVLVCYAYANMDGNIDLRKFK